jgi:hypothetical protein
MELYLGDVAETKGIKRVFGGGGLGRMPRRDICWVLLGLLKLFSRCWRYIM